MATKSLAPLEFPQKPGPKKAVTKVIISQERLSAYAKLEAQIDKLNAKLGPEKDALKAALEAGAEIEPGAHHAHLKVTERRSVPWKEIVERELGEAYAERVMAATKPGKAVSLVVD